MKIVDLLGVKEQIKKTKIHFAIGAEKKEEPLRSFLNGNFKEWQEVQRNKNFERDYILSLIYYGKNEWLFGGIYKRIGLKEEDGKFIYTTELLDNANELIGRLIIKYEKLFRQSYTYAETCINEFDLLEILRKKYSIEPFPGYENVRIDFELLKTIILKEEESWKTALSNVKGVYLISDIKTGKLYVGAAYGENAFWNRWTNYIRTGHGGNEGLKNLIREKGVEYAKNFQFAILETSNMKEDDAVKSRESFWKNVLLSKEFGYNKN
jgi:hypothetical protein